MNSPACVVPPEIFPLNSIFECDLCHLPHQYRCADCKDIVLDENQDVRINIASGEDVCLSPIL